MKIQDLRYLFAYLIPFSAFHALELQNYFVLSTLFLAITITSIFQPVLNLSLKNKDQKGEQQRRTKVLITSGKNWIRKEQFLLLVKLELRNYIYGHSRGYRRQYVNSQMIQEEIDLQKNYSECSKLYLGSAIQVDLLPICFNQVKLKAHKS